MGGRAKKRRSGRCVTRKPKKNGGLVILNKVQHPFVKDMYDKDLTPKENLRSMGLDANPNSLEEIRINKSNKSAAFLGFAPLSSMSMDIVDQNAKRKKISDMDVTYVKACIAIHGTNYKAMERDIATNYRQLSENQAKKLCEKYLSLE